MSGAHTTNFSVLDSMQKLCLHGKRKLSDFIQKESASVGFFKQTAVEFAGIGKSAGFVSEKLCLNEGFRYG